jgi:hypothetical protein
MLRLRSGNTVFILENCSAQEEYDIVHSRPRQSRRETGTKLSGDCLLVYENPQEPIADLKGADLIYSEENEGVFNLYLSLVSIPAFQHFLVSLVEKCPDLEDLSILSSMHKFLQHMVDGKEHVVDDLLPEATVTRYSDLYSDLLSTLHSELCERYFFEEDEWSAPNKENARKSRPIYQEYSPIVEIFQGKVKNGLYQLKGPSFEKIRLSSNGHSTVRRAVEQLRKEERCFVTKMPQILMFFVDDSKIELESNNDVYFEKAHLLLHAFITETESSSYCYVRHGNDWYEYSRTDVRRCTTTDTMGYPSILLYSPSQ